MKKRIATRSVLALSLVRGVGPVFFKKNHNKIKAAINEGYAYDYFSNLLPPKTVRSDWSKALEDADTALERYENTNVIAVSVLDSTYPKKLLETAKPPPVLFCRGNIGLLDSKTVTVIGSRKSSKLGEIIAQRVGTYFANNHISICNGLADGVDSHCIQTNERFLENSIGVIGSGLDLFEVKSNSKSITHRALNVLDAGGLIVSEAMPGAKEDTYSVISSCRIQAGLGDAMILIQSSITGGSRFTVAAYCGLPRLFSFISPPEQEKNHESFAANAQLSQDGIAGLKAFAEVNDVGETQIFPVKSRNDYAYILHQLTHNAGLLT